MDRQSDTPGPEIGWAFGGVGFIATVLVGWLVGAGVGFGVFAVVFWTGMGSLFAFLVERSTIEEHDRVDELHNTRLATLAPVAVRPARPSEPARPAEPAVREPDERPEPLTGALRPDTVARTADDAPRRDDTAVRRARPVAPGPQPRSPREYREARAEAERQRHAAA